MKFKGVLTMLLAVALSLGTTGPSFARGEGKSAGSSGGAAGLSRSGQATALGGSKLHQQSKIQSRDKVQTRSQSQLRSGQTEEGRPEAGTPRGTGDGTADPLQTGDRLQDRIHQTPDTTITGD